jgi:hypothetical protein
MKLIIIDLLISLLLINAILNLTPEKNQATAFPNTNEAPTMSSNIPLSDFKPPKFSLAILETDPKRKLRLSEFLQTVKYSLYKMTRGEAEQLFSFIDQNHDDLINHEEWDAFVTLYILPFEACDENGDYVHSVEEFSKCFEADPKSKLITFRRRYMEKRHNLIMSVVSTRGNDMINFSDYLFIRRTMFAWQKCQSTDKYISISQFKCAFTLAVPNKYHMKLTLEDIYKTGLNLANDKALIQLDYISYLRILYFSYVFSIYTAPHDIPFLEKQQFIKSIKEDRFPLNWEESEVEYLYTLININPFEKEFTMNFSSFTFFFNLHRLFNKYSIQKPLQLNPEEMEKLLSDPLCPRGITLAVDMSKTKIQESDYLEASLVLQKKRVNEDNFYFSFKQDASLTTASFHETNNVNALYQDFYPNKDNRDTFFSTSIGVDKQYMTKDSFYKTFLFANLFTSMCEDKRWIVSVPFILENMMTYYEKVNPPIAQKYRNNLVNYKILPREYSLDLLTFLQLEAWSSKIKKHNISSNDYINETLLKIILNDFGMKNMPDTVIDLGKSGYDSLRRRIYSPQKVFSALMITHASAAENLRNKESIRDYQLKLNNEDSRKFPNFDRRFLSGPKV